MLIVKINLPATLLLLKVPLVASNGDENVTLALALHENSDPDKVMMMRAGKAKFCWNRSWGVSETSIRTPEADATGGTTVKVGDPTPIVEATTTSSLPFVPVAMIDPAEFNMAERMLELSGCGTLAVVTLNKSICKDELLLIEKAPDRVNLKTGEFGESAIIVADVNVQLGGEMICPCAGLGNDHPAPTKVMMKTEGACAARMLMVFGMKEMLMVVNDSMALFVNCNKG